MISRTDSWSPWLAVLWSGDTAGTFSTRPRGLHPPSLLCLLPLFPLSLFHSSAYLSLPNSSLNNARSLGLTVERLLSGIPSINLSMETDPDELQRASREQRDHETGVEFTRFAFPLDHLHSWILQMDRYRRDHPCWFAQDGGIFQDTGL